jgi:two-component system, LytTR family, response regulator
MKVILIDDENLALHFLEHQLKKVAPELKIIGKFTDPMAWKENRLLQEADVVFLDIHLPEVNGVELAELLLEAKPALHIVFVTAYDDYAIKAFELNALDYVLKPVGTERLLKTIRRIQERVGEGLPKLESPRARKTLKIQLFLQVLIESNDGVFLPIRWRTNKAQELFLFLLQHTGQHTRKGALIDLLWPDLEPDRAYSQLYTAIYHVRKGIEPFKDYLQLSNASDGYILKTQGVELDTKQWEGCIASGLPVSSESIEKYEAMMLLYKGDYLQDYDYWWVESERQRFRALWLKAALQIASWYAASDCLDQALEKYEEIVQRFPQSEEAHFAIMKLHAAQNQHVSIHRQYKKLTTILLNELHVLPSPYIMEWYESFKATSK